MTGPALAGIGSEVKGRAFLSTFLCAAKRRKEKKTLSARTAGIVKNLRTGDPPRLPTPPSLPCSIILGAVPSPLRTFLLDKRQKDPKAMPIRLRRPSKEPGPHAPSPHHPRLARVDSLKLHRRRLSTEPEVQADMPAAKRRSEAPGKEWTPGPAGACFVFCAHASRANKPVGLGQARRPPSLLFCLLPVASPARPSHPHHLHSRRRAHPVRPPAHRPEDGAPHFLRVQRGRRRRRRFCRLARPGRQGRRGRRLAVLLLPTGRGGGGGHGGPGHAARRCHSAGRGHAAPAAAAAPRRVCCLTREVTQKINKKNC